MTTQVLLQHVSQAREARDPKTVELLIEVINSEPDPQRPPPREGAYSFPRFLREISEPVFYRQPAEVQAQQRIEKMKALDSPDAEPLEEKFRSHEFILSLWESDEFFDRKCLLEVIRKVPLVYGPWKALKQIFKEAESVDDTQVMGELSARFDTAFSSGSHGVSQRTLGYLTRRSWRYLRRIAESLPACYADTAVDFLVGYPKGRMAKSWVYNHIFQHEVKVHGRTRFHFTYRKKLRAATEYTKSRAYPELWKRSPLPLFALLQQAKNSNVLQFAVSALKSDFRTVLRDIEPRWVRQLISRDEPVVHKFVVWILENVPRFEQAKFRELELHDSVLHLLDSTLKEAKEFAAKYARVHARDLPVSELIRLANSSDSKVRDLANDLIRAHDPRSEIGLDAWGQLLEAKYGHEMAVEALRKHFTAADLTPDWFRARLLSGNRQAAKFARTRLLEVHSLKQLGVEYFYDLFDQGLPNRHEQSIRFAIEQMGKMDLNEIDIRWLEQFLICSTTRPSVIQWCRQGLLDASRFDVEFLKAISFHASFAACPAVIEAHSRPRHDYVQHDESITSSVFEWLSDIRKFTPDQIGFEWLMNMVQREEPLYHNFATELMVKSYLPADFATDSAADTNETSSSKEDINIDFDGATFVFTGKLATMTRSEAQGKVTKANGKNSGTVGKSLNYLVIGDEGSPMYGMGRKGSKQVKAESLNESGGAIRIISETAFLQMLTGTAREFSEDAVIDGCETLWAMLCENPEGTPLSRFAIKYVRHHHPEICLAETDRPVDPGSELPDEFLTFERLQPLLSDSRKPLRDLGLEFARFEFARMAPPMDELLELCQLPYPAVRKFVAESLTAKPTPQNRRWRLDPDSFTSESVYQFCQSRDAETRAIGMKLIDAQPRLREPDQLFALTESPDRIVRAFVIRSFWSLYRDRGVTREWRPTQTAEDGGGRKQSKGSDVAKDFGNGAPPRPAELPASHQRLQFLLRRMLFEIPPGRPPKSSGNEIDELKVKPLSTRRAKLLLVETVRDTAVSDLEFAQVVLPVLREFMQSQGMSEHDACLVAVTRIEHVHPQLKDEATS